MASSASAAVPCAAASSGSPAPVVADQTTAASSPAVEPVAQSDALPPPADRLTGGHASLGGWRAATCGVFLILAGLTLIARRMVARGPENRRD
ncbi:hypothetical protein E6W39_22645 [Kitasatospora acidiphila]|uniref:Uncharacterized protein n=1 Tax=Kitasatospora acidiphila TaxID=2567942 RepID=A0A540W822_9ACTN|nr:hypothetical protein [Kitasatospora acidiphila]TQF04514.1 hypothetical protein E6W39_22645 [Kitasatospora acidiphila]